MTGAPHQRPPSSKKRPPTEDERAQRDRFKNAVIVACGGACLVHPDGVGCVGPLQAHHVVTQQQIRDRGRHDLLWDWRNGVAVCEHAHTRHTKAVERIPRAALPSRCVAWATLHGFDALIDRYYTPEDA